MVGNLSQAVQRVVLVGVGAVQVLHFDPVAHRVQSVVEGGETACTGLTPGLSISKS